VIVVRKIILVDTSVFVNILDIPGLNQNRNNTIKQLRIYVKDTACNLLLPVATIIESGNHIAKLSDGRQRRRFASIFCSEVTKAIDGMAQWQAMRPPTSQDIKEWMATFPDSAMRQVSMGDISIKCDWKKTSQRHSGDRVLVWSLDGDLSECDSEL